MSKPKNAAVKPQPNPIDTDDHVSYEVLDAIPVPPRTNSKRSKYPFAEIPLTEGDEAGVPYFFPGKELKPFRATVYQASRRLQRKFRVRAWDNQGVKGVAVWRVE